MDVGFIGLGHMGAPMALNLLKAGHRVVVQNRTRSKAEALTAKGAQVAEKITDTCHGDVLVTMLSDGPWSRMSCSDRAAFRFSAEIGFTFR
jgi:3-hydroxyisobutyrate dehydrogenase-like beta-hydroxyacid dehydrogenase